MAIVGIPGRGDDDTGRYSDQQLAGFAGVGYIVIGFFVAGHHPQSRAGQHPAV